MLLAAAAETWTHEGDPEHGVLGPALAVIQRAYELNSRAGGVAQAIVGGGLGYVLVVRGVLPLDPHPAYEGYYIVKMSLRVVDSGQGLRFEHPGVLGSEQLTLADLRLPSAAKARIHVLFFPSRFDTPFDKACKESLRRFGQNTPDTTRVDFWDLRDQHVAKALQAFKVAHPPAVVLTTGFEIRPDDSLELSSTYQISFTEQSIFEDEKRFEYAIGTAYEVMDHGEAWEIALLIKQQRRQELLDKLAAFGRHLRDQLVALHPTFTAGPQGVTISLGS